MRIMSIRRSHTILLGLSHGSCQDEFVMTVEVIDSIHVQCMASSLISSIDVIRQAFSKEAAIVRIDQPSMDGYVLMRVLLSLATEFLDRKESNSKAIH